MLLQEFPESVKPEGARHMGGTVLMALGGGRQVPPAGLAGGKTVYLGPGSQVPHRGAHRCVEERRVHGTTQCAAQFVTY